MSSLFDPKNPDSENHIRRLAESVPSMVDEQLKRKSSKAQRSYARFCPICGLLYDRLKVYAPAAMKEGKCEKCRKLLVDGCTALVTVSRRYALVTLPVPLRDRLMALAGDEANDLTADDRAFFGKLVNMEPGETVTLTDEEMDAVENLTKKP